MVDFTKTFSEIWDDYITHDTPASGVKPVDKEDMREWGGVVEDALTALPAPEDIVQPDDIATLVSAYNQANASVVRKDLRVMLMVVSALTYAPPGSPSSGDMYIVPTGATGSWSAQVGKIAFYTAGAWTYLTPADGWSAFSKDTDLLYIYDTSAWVQASSSVVSVTASLVQVSLLGKPTAGGGGKVKTWLTANNDVFAAGDNTNLQNGYTVAPTDLPVKVQFNTTPGTITKIVQSATSTYILDNTGKVWSLGGNAAGQLGHADTTSRQVATRIEYFVSNSLAIADIFASGDASGSNDYVFFLTTGGAAYACGSNATGQLGLGDTTQRTTPTLVSAVSGIARLVCSGNNNAHSLAITTAGALWTTGYNAAGQLGQGDTTQRTTFTVVTGFTNASKGAASGSSTTAVGNSFVLKTDGTVWATGYNAQGQLGQSDTTTRNAFIQVSALSSITDIQASPDYICTVAALKSDGNVYVWGGNGAGQCGTANTTNQTAPQAPTFTGQGTVAQIAVAAHTTNGAVYCRTSTGTMWAAGLSTNGNLGVNSTSAAVTSFTQCVGLDGTVSDFCVTGTAGNFGPAVLYSDGRTATAGDNSKGQLGLGTGTSNSAIFHQVSSLTPRGVRGDDGAIGADGATAGVGFNFSTTTTDSDPGSGILRLNAVPASATAAYIDNENRSGGSVSGWVDTFDDMGNSSARGILQIFDPSAPDTNYRIYLVAGSVVDGTGYRKLTLTHLNGAGSFSDAQHVRVAFGAHGIAGAAGATIGIGFNYSTTTTDSDPGSGIFRLNNATPGSATAGYFDNNDRNGVAVSAWLDTLDDSGNSSLRGQLFLIDPAASSVRYVFNVSGSVVDGTGYRKVTLAYVSGSGSFTNGNEVTAFFVARGATGSGDLASANNLSDVASPKSAFDTLTVHGADVASASTIDLDAATGYLVDVTGTTTITDITLANGRVRVVRFTGALTLTNGASLVLPGGANITTAAGDFAIFEGYAAGVVRCSVYSKATGKAVVTSVTSSDISAAVLAALAFGPYTTIASATTTDLSTVATVGVSITGTTTITGFGTGASLLRIGKFAAALTLTHNGTSLILPGSLNIATAAGDRFVALSDASGNWTVIDYVRADGHPLTTAQATIASATTTDLGSVLAQEITVSGTTTITGFGSSAPTGAVKDVYFSGALLLTHNGTSLILPAATNITTVAGDCLRARHEGSGNWRVLGYTKSTGAPVRIFETIIIPVSDESTSITTGTAKVTFRMPFAMTLTAVRASLTTVSSSGNPAIDINEAGASIFSTTLTIDASEKTSTTAATPAVLSDTSLADDAEMTIDIDTAGTGAKGLKVTLIGYRT